MEDINSMFANSAAPTTISELTTIMEKISTHFTKETQELRDVVTALRDRVEALEGKLEGQQAPVYVYRATALWFEVPSLRANR